MTPTVVAMTGASGAIYGARLLQALLAKGTFVQCVISASAETVIEQELGVPTNKESPAELLKSLTSTNELAETAEHAAALEWAEERLQLFENSDFMAAAASGSQLTEGMVICPCSGTTLSGVATGRSDNLIQRAAEVHLKERRKLILVTRETPVSLVHLENQVAVTRAGAVVLPASPGWYHGATQILDLVDFVVGRVLDQLGHHCDLMKRWGAD